MSFGEQMRRRREELGMSRSELAQRLGVSVSAVGNYETGVSAPKEEVLLRLFNALEADPNYLYRGSYLYQSGPDTDEERRLLTKYRALPLAGRQTVHTLLDALTVMTDQVRQTAPAADPRTIPIYTSPSAAGFAARELEVTGAVWRIDMTKCPYHDACVRYGCPELCPCFCDSDDITYGDLHPRLLWRRTETLGRGGGRCDFCLKIKEDGR